MNIKKSVSIVIPNYNGKHLLDEYIPFTIAAADNSGSEYEIIIVDDCSSDHSVEFIKTNYSQIRLIQNQENKGFSHSCNQGIFASRHELILLLNSDVKLSHDYFEKLWPYFGLKDTFGVMGRIIDMDSDNIQDAARALRISGFKFKTDFFYSLNSEAHVPTIYLSGANALIDARKLQEIGGFDEIFSPFYGEDLDLGLRAWKLGWKCYYEHNAICRHQMSASTKNYKTANWVKTIYFRNRFYVHAIHLKGMTKLMWTLQILADIVVKIFTGQFWIFKSYKMLFNDADAITQSRKRLNLLMKKHKSKRDVDKVDSEFKSMLTGLNIKWLRD